MKISDAKLAKIGNVDVKKIYSGSDLVWEDPNNGLNPGPEPPNNVEFPSSVVYGWDYDMLEGVKAPKVGDLELIYGDSQGIFGNPITAYSPSNCRYFYPSYGTSAGLYVDGQYPLTDRIPTGICAVSGFALLSKDQADYEVNELYYLSTAYDRDVDKWMCMISLGISSINTDETGAYLDVYVACQQQDMTGGSTPMLGVGNSRFASEASIRPNEWFQWYMTNDEGSNDWNFGIKSNMDDGIARLEGVAYPFKMQNAAWFTWGGSRQTSSNGNTSGMTFANTSFAQDSLALHDSTYNFEG